MDKHWHVGKRVWKARRTPPGSLLGAVRGVFCLNSVADSLFLTQRTGTVGARRTALRKRPFKKEKKISSSFCVLCVTDNSAAPWSAGPRRSFSAQPQRGSSSSPTRRRRPYDPLPLYSTWTRRRVVPSPVNTLGADRPRPTHSPKPPARAELFSLAKTKIEKRIETSSWSLCRAGLWSHSVVGKLKFDSESRLSYQTV